MHSLGIKDAAAPAAEKKDDDEVCLRIITAIVCGRTLILCKQKKDDDGEKKADDGEKKDDGEGLSFVWWFVFWCLTANLP